jgi:hypothetical protein
MEPHVTPDNKETPQCNGNKTNLPAGKLNTPAPTMLLMRLKTSLGIVAVPPPCCAPPRSGSSGTAAAADDEPSFPSCVEVVDDDDDTLLWRY